MCLKRKLVLSQIKDFNLTLLGGKTFFQGYRTDVNPSTFAVFAVVPYRFGDSTVQEEFRRFSKNGFEHKSSNNERCEGGIHSILRRLVKSPAAEEKE